MQWLPLAFEFVTTVGLALGLDHVSKLSPWWLRLVAMTAWLSVALVLAAGLVFLGAFGVGLVIGSVR